jgi:hypothetical protein
MKNFDKLSFLYLAIGSTNKTSTGGLNWPSVSAGENFFDCVLASGKLEGSIEPMYANGDVAGAAVSCALDAWAREEVHGEIDPQEGRELDADGEELHSEHGDKVAMEEDEELGAGATLGISEMPTNMQVGNLKAALSLRTPMRMWLVLQHHLHWMHEQGRRSMGGLYTPPPNPSGVRLDTWTVLGLCSDFAQTLLGLFWLRVLPN